MKTPLRLNAEQSSKIMDSNITFMKQNIKFYSNKGAYQLLKTRIDKMRHLGSDAIIDNLTTEFELSDTQIKFINKKIQQQHESKI